MHLAPSRGAPLCRARVAIRAPGGFSPKFRPTSREKWRMQMSMKTAKCMVVLMIVFGYLARAEAQVLNSAAGLQEIRSREVAQELVQLSQQANSAETWLEDWADLNRYRKENSALSPTTKLEQRVVFYGDSITDAWGSPGTGDFFPGKAYVNRGISGQTTPQLLIRFSQ